MAVAESCIEFPPEAKPEERARLVAMLGIVLDLESPYFINLVATREKNQAYLLRKGMYSLSFTAGSDGKWRLSRQSVSILPDLYSQAMEQGQRLNEDRSTMIDGLGDPTELIVTFMDRATRGDFQGAAQCLDMSGVAPEKRREVGRDLARKLALVFQRLPYPHPQNIPVDPKHRPFTYFISNDGTIIGERIHLDGQPDRWQFTRQSVQDIERLYNLLKERPIDPRWILLDRVVPVDTGPADSDAPPKNIPAKYGSPRAMLRGFLQDMDQADHNGSQATWSQTRRETRGGPPQDPPQHQRVGQPLQRAAGYPGPGRNQGPYRPGSGRALAILRKNRRSYSPDVRGPQPEGPRTGRPPGWSQFPQGNFQHLPAIHE
jgi:hypothetical protein